MESPIKIKINKKTVTQKKEAIVKEAVLGPEDVKKIILKYVEGLGFKVDKVRLVCDFKYSGEFQGPHVYFKDAIVEFVNEETAWKI